MADHRIRLTDDDILLIIAALKARRAMAKGLREHRVDRLVARLSEGVRGNPKFSLGEFEQAHEDDEAAILRSRLLTLQHDLEAVQAERNIVQGQLDDCSEQALAEGDD